MDAQSVAGDASSQSPGAANCYVFKSRLQEYVQKAGFPTPEYHTVKEGPSHEPVFKSMVVVNNVTYDSLPGFFNRKAAEQSAAEIALMEIFKSGQTTESLPAVHETGLCKNLLQEYAQKMNYAIPTYVCYKQLTGPFTCTVEIGGIQYIGAAARTKKEAEIKAARTALVAIQSQSVFGANGAAQHTVLPIKKKGKEPEKLIETAKQLKPKKANFKKKWNRRRSAQKKDEQTLKPDNDESGNTGIEGASEAIANDGGVLVASRDAEGELVGESVCNHGKESSGASLLPTNGACRNAQVASDVSGEEQVSYDIDVFDFEADII